MEHNVTGASDRSLSDNNTRSNDSNISGVLEQQQMPPSEGSASSPAAMDTSAGQATTSTTTNTSRAADSKHLQNSDLRRRPKIQGIQLTSTSATSSAFPQSLGLWISRRGGWIIAANSSHLYLLYAPDLPQLSARAFGVRRRPLTAEILEDGSVLCVLSNEHQVDIYSLGDIGERIVTRVRTIFLENAAFTMAMTPDGLVLATGSDAGIELASLAPDARESKTRQLYCEPMDSLAFSNDGRTLLATSSARRQKGSTVFSVNSDFGGPMTEDGIPILLDVDKAWITQILFPEKAPKAQQAALLPDWPTGAVDQLFAFDSIRYSYGVYNLVDETFSEMRQPLKYNADSVPEASPTSRNERCRVANVPPAVSGSRSYAAAAIIRDGSTEILIYRLQKRCGDNEPSSERSTECTEDPFLSPSFRFALSDHAAVSGISDLRWSLSSTSNTDNHERLIAIGLVSGASFEDIAAGGSTASHGCIILIDLNAPELEHESGEQPDSITIDLDTITETEVLPGQELAFEEAVNLVRKRTVAQRRANTVRQGIPRSSTRAATAAARRDSDLIPVSDAANGRHRDSSGQPNEDAQAALEEPYTQGAPRSQVSLHRAATVLAASPAARRHLRALPDRPLEYRRADGLREIPHESDADDWEPPPPPYTPNAPQPAPNVISTAPTRPQHSLLVPRVPFTQQHSGGRVRASSTSSTLYQYGPHAHSSPNLLPQPFSGAPRDEPTYAPHTSIDIVRPPWASMGNRSFSDNITSRQRSPPQPNTVRNTMWPRADALPAVLGHGPVMSEQPARPKKVKRTFRCVIM